MENRWMQQNEKIMTLVCCGSLTSVHTRVCIVFHASANSSCVFPLPLDAALHQQALCLVS